MACWFLPSLSSVTLLLDDLLVLTKYSFYYLGLDGLLVLNKSLFQLPVLLDCFLALTKACCYYLVLDGLLVLNNSCFCCLYCWMAYWFLVSLVSIACIVGLLCGSY